MSTAINVKKLQREAIRLLKAALDEDHYQFDFTSQAIFTSDDYASYRVNARENIIFTGVFFFEAVKKIFPKIQAEILVKDGDFIAIDQTIARIHGPTLEILGLERSLLNIIQHLSGISTITKKYVDLISHTKCKILDTRKTLPTFRVWQKYAVLVGGGMNHRFSLADYAMIKDNHLLACKKDLKDIVNSLKARNLKVEIECDDLSQINQILLALPDRIMLDNMSTQNVKTAVALIGNICEIEVSGGINLDNVKDYAELGVDFISIGRLTHSVIAVDIGLD